MTEPSVRIGVLGCGRIGRMHAELLARRVPGAACAGVFDVVTEAATDVSDQLGVVCFGSPGELIASNEVDAVAICTSTDTHVDLIEAAAEAGKPILCEKPVSLDLAAIDRAAAAVARSGVLFQVGFNRRFDPSHAEVRHRVESGDVGRVEMVRITSRDPAPPPIAYIERSGGIFLDMSIHDFDMARFVTGSDVESVFATGAVRVDPAIGAAGDLDTVVVVLTHTDGTITTIDNSRRAVYGYDQRVEVFGSEGMALSDNPLATTTVFRGADGAEASALPWFFLDRYIPSYLAEWEAFVAAVRGAGPSLVGMRDGREPLLIGLAAILSRREGRTVALTEVDPTRRGG